MEDKDIIKALELCKTKGVADCKECCFRIDENEINSNCVNELCENALDLINRQKAEIERLKRSEEGINKIIDNLCNIQTARAEVITEFAERLKEKKWSARTTFGMRDFVEVIVIDQIAKEMKGGGTDA